MASVAIPRGALGGARRRLSSGRYGAWRGRVLALCGVLTSACGGPQKGADEGGDCFRDADCREGLVCIEGSCSNDLDRLVSMVEGPNVDGAGASGNASTSVSSAVTSAGGSTTGSGAASGAGGSTKGAGAASAGGSATMAATVDSGAGGSSTSSSTDGSGGSPSSTVDTTTSSTSTQGVSGAGGAP